VAALALAVSVALISWPLLFRMWLRADYDRFLWILLQPQPCASLGGMVVQASWTLVPAVAGVALLIALGLAGFLRRAAIAGIAFGAVLTLSLTAVMLLSPMAFARVIGCA